MAERMAASMYHFIPRKKGKYKKQYYKVAAQKQRGSYIVYRTDLRRNDFAALRRMYLRIARDTARFLQRTFCIEGNASH